MAFRRLVEQSKRLGVSTLVNIGLITALYPITSKNVENIRSVKDCFLEPRSAYGGWSKFWPVGLRNRIAFTTVNEYFLSHIIRRRASLCQTPLVVPTKVLMRRSGSMIQRDSLACVEKMLKKYVDPHRGGRDVV
eukprot:GHVH01003448.1.p1 GENE.GHVH01003448.1~~GHVH01003448.1.p1  ORF type:complete len:134 (-),score=5.60 GHVH01003448.1:373-774(-)